MAFLRFKFVLKMRKFLYILKDSSKGFQLEYNKKYIVFLNVRSDFTSFFKKSRGYTEFLKLLLLYMQLVLSFV
jgi:hypothetical protein